MSLEDEVTDLMMQPVKDSEVLQRMEEVEKAGKGAEIDGDWFDVFQVLAASISGQREAILRLAREIDGKASG